MPDPGARPTLLMSMAVAVLAVSIPITASGCTYFSYPDPPLEYVASRTPTIFLGTLIQRRTQIRKWDGDKYELHTLLFRVDDNLKGDNPTRVTITTWDRLTNRDSCYEEPPKPNVGEQWVVYRGYDEETTVWLNVRDMRFLSWHFDAGDPISRKKLQSVKDAISYHRSTFFGEVEMAMVDSPPSADAAIKAELMNPDGRTIQNLTLDDKGKFAFPDLPPGLYTVRIRSSKQYELFQPEKLMMQQDVDGASFVADFKIQMRPGLPEFAAFVLMTL